MAKREILIAPHPLLKQVCDPVAEVDEAVRALMDDMLETMYDAEGIGLAASQIGDMRRVVVMDLSGRDEEPAPQFFVNPEITWQSEDTRLYNEGCLSIPGLYEEVERPSRVRARYLDYSGEAKEVEADGLLATCLQHEIDHLNGVLFWDHLSRLKRSMMMRRLQKAMKSKESA